ncbi:hypothetical protein MP638_001770 [Amoeboaphelidium occidentale]|nr:hypothetical protein MP638_001770 [Amoeboaphelidium occidentale]
MGIQYDATLYYGIRFGLEDLKHLKTNPLVLEKPGVDFEDCLLEYWYGEIEGVFLATESPFYDCGAESREFYVASPAHKTSDCFTKEEIQAALKDDKFIDSLKSFCKKFGLKYQEPKLYVSMDVC